MPVKAETQDPIQDNLTLRIWVGKRYPLSEKRKKTYRLLKT